MASRNPASRPPCCSVHDGISLPSNEQAALAASVGRNAASAAQGIARSNAGNDAGNTASTNGVSVASTNIGTQATQAVPVQFDCSTGAIRTTENTILDIGEETYLVEFDSNGNVTVDGEAVDVSDTADNCDFGDGPNNDS